MKLLSIETSTRDLSLAVSEDDKILRYRNFSINKILESSIIPTIKKILKSANISLSKIDGFVVGLGPGSFTGLRVGLSTIKALAFALNKPVVGISSLDAIAFNIKDEKIQICTISDAKRNLLYACLYEKNKMVIKRKTDYLLINIHDLLEKVTHPTIFIGDGINLYKSEIEKRTNFLRFEDEKYWKPQAKNLVPFACDRFKKKEFDSIDQLVPLYLYSQDCQVRKKR